MMTTARLPQNPQPKNGLPVNFHNNELLITSRLILLMGKGYGVVYMSRAVAFACPGCYNRVAQNFRYGEPSLRNWKIGLLRIWGQSYVQGLTLLGGEPFLNTQVCIRLCRRIRQEFGHDKDIWSWSGYAYEELMQDSEDKLTLLSLIDILVDGRFLLAKKDLTLQFRGSSNQRIIDVPATQAAGEIKLWKNLIR